MIDKKRRTVLKATLASGVLAGVAGTGILAPTRLLAAWSQDAFMAEDLQEAIDILYGKPVDLAGANSDAISFEDTQESPADSRSVPISISSTVPNTESISIFVEGNPRPLVGQFRFESNAIPAVHVRSKMRKTSRVIAIMKDSAGKFYTKEMKISVTESGCAP